MLLNFGIRDENKQSAFNCGNVVRFQGIIFLLVPFLLQSAFNMNDANCGIELYVLLLADSYNLR